MVSVATKLGIGTPETVRKWVRAAEAAGNPKAVSAAEESAELRRLKVEVRELRRANEILQSCSGFLRGRARPATTELVRFIAEHADQVTVDGLRWGVEPICRVLTEHGTRIAPNTPITTRGPLLVEASGA